MPSSRPDPAAGERLRLAPTFSLCTAFDGRPFVAQDTEPYTQYWVSERERALLGLFGRRGGLAVEDALAAWSRLEQRPLDAALGRRMRAEISAMRDAGVLVDASADPSRYDRRVVADYLRHRPFPAALVRRMVALGGLDASSRVLDLAGGPGDLALKLAPMVGQVTLMELSRGFVAAARARARAKGLSLEVIHESANRLMFHDGRYPAITLAQAIHWLDDVQVCRGVIHALEDGGSLFVVQSAFDVPDTHPLAYVLGRQSILGPRGERRFEDEVAALARRLALLFDALDTPEVERYDRGGAAARGAARIVPVAIEFHRQKRPFDTGFLRAFVTPRHLEAAGIDAQAFWREADARAAGARKLAGTHDWAVLQFRRGGKRIDPEGVARLKPRAMPFEPGEG